MFLNLPDSRQKSMARQEATFAVKLISPMVIIFVLFGLFPILYSFWISLHDWRLNIVGGPKFIGFTNYVYAFGDKIFLESLLKTFYFVLLVVSFGIVLGLIFALALNQEKIRHKEWILTLSLLPWAVPKVVGGLMWKWIFDGNYGILNATLESLGFIDSYRWWFTGSPWIALGLAAVVEIWRTVPFTGLMFFAGLQKIPKVLYEAASLDGANEWQKFRFITWPELGLVIMATLVLVTTWALKTFDTIYTLTGGGPGTKTMITYLYVYQQAFNYLNVGYGAALGYLLTILVLLFSFVYYGYFTKQ